MHSPWMIQGCPCLNAVTLYDIWYLTRLRQHPTRTTIERIQLWNNVSRASLKYWSFIERFDANGKTENSSRVHETLRDSEDLAATEVRMLSDSGLKTLRWPWNLTYHTIP